jgi:SAM-dependent methyltransferase
MDIVYDRCEEEWERCLHDEEKQRMAATWMQEGTLDRWRHHRMLDPIKPLISAQTSWLTLGDGRYGTDAHFILANGGKAHATDLSDKLLKIGSEAGFIGSYGAENAEQLSFADDCFDYVLIKDSFHHFPRPWLALYEAFRVCRQAVILIEPNDDESHWRTAPLSALTAIGRAAKRWARKVIGKNVVYPHSYWFEDVGNFVYCINPQELEKFLLGIHKRHIATLGLNDAYEPGVEFISLANPTEADQAVIKRVQSSIQKQDRLCRLGLASPGMLLAALFKRPPSDSLADQLTAKGWFLKELPENPHLKP